MDISLVLRPFILLSLLAVAAVTDLLRHRVSNLLLAIGFMVEAAVHLLVTPEISREPLGLAVLFILVLFILFTLRLIGGADVKLYALCIFTYPNETGLRIICLSMLVAAAYSLVLMLRQGNAVNRYIRLLRYVSSLLSAGVSTGTAAVAAETVDMDIDTGAIGTDVDRTKSTVKSCGYIDEADIAGGEAVPMAAAILAGAVLALIQGGIL